MKLSLIFTSITLLLFSSCKTEDDASLDDTSPNENIQTEVNYLTNDSDYIFDQDKLLTYDLTLSESALAELDADPTAEEYVAGALTLEGETISEVGIRYKGSVASWMNCLTGDDFFNPSGSKVCSKLSMKIKINWEGRDEKFFDQKKLQFHSMNNDDSQMHERLGYWLFRQMGVPAPRCVHAKLNINGEYAGLFALVEQIDNRFVKENYDDDDGNLYKEVWPLTGYGDLHNDQVYADALKTNEDDDPNFSIIKGLGQGIIDATTTEEAQEVVEQYLDVDEIMSYVATSTVIKHDDGALHWYYTDDDGLFNHNYFWYEETSEEKLHLIAWDLDLAFGNIQVFNPVGSIADPWGEITNDCEIFISGIVGQRSAACEKLTGTWATYTDLFDEKKAKLIEGPLSASTVDGLLATWKNQVSEATLEASEAHDDAITIEEWESQLDKLKTDIEYARNN